MEAYNESTRPGVAENDDESLIGGTRTPNKGNSAQRGQSGGQQDRIDKWLLAPPIPNIEAVGNPLRPRTDRDRILRVGFQNIRGADTNNGLGLALELDAMNKIGADTQGMTKANKPWNSMNKTKYQIQLDLLYNRLQAI